MRHHARIMVLGLLFTGLLAGLAYADGERVRLSSASEQVHVLDGEEVTPAYIVNPFAPLRVAIEGPGSLTLQVYKTFSVADPYAAEYPATFQIYRDGKVTATISHHAPKKEGLRLREEMGLTPGAPKSWTAEIPKGETWDLGVVLSPDTGLVAVIFTPAEEEAPAGEPELIPLVPLVPLVPLAPAKPVEPAPAPVVEASKPVEPIPAPVEELKPEPPKPEEPKPEPPKPEPPKPEEPAPAPAEEAKPEEAKPEEAKPAREEGPKYVMIEPRLGLNLAIQSVNVAGSTSLETNPMFTAGATVAYILPVLDERFRVGLSFDWQQYSYTADLPWLKADADITLTSVPMMVSFDAFILTRGLVRPFVGAGIGANWVRMQYVQINQDSGAEMVRIDSKDWTYAAALWAGVQFNVWQGGPFAKVRYTISRNDYDGALDENTGARNGELKNAEHGGLSFLAGYQFEF